MLRHGDGLCLQKATRQCLVVLGEKSAAGKLWGDYRVAAACTEEDLDADTFVRPSACFPFCPIDPKPSHYMKHKESLADLLNLHGPKFSRDDLVKHA